MCGGRPGPRPKSFPDEVIGLGHALHCLPAGRVGPVQEHDVLAADLGVAKAAGGQIAPGGQRGKQRG